MNLTRTALAALVLAVATTPALADRGGKDKPGRGPAEASQPREPTPEERAKAQADAMRGYLAGDMLFVTAPAIEAYLNDIAGRLLATQASPPAAPKFLVQSTRDFKVETHRHGYIIVSTEVLRTVESEDELAAALSHELGHMLARHVDTKSVVLQVKPTVETLGFLAGAVDTRLNDAGLRPGQLTDFSRDTLAATQSVGAVWSDLVAPTWNRQQEREADLAGVDMVRAAGYDPAGFSSLFTRIDAAHAVRSERVELVRQEALKKIQARAVNTRPQAGAGTADQARDTLKQLRLEAQATAIESVFTRLSDWSTDYDSPEQRTAAVLEYAQHDTATRRDKTRRSPRFAAELREGDGGRLLAADAEALDVVAVVADRKRPPPVQEMPARLRLDAAGEPLSPHLNYAMGLWLDAARQPAAAEQRAVAWMNSPVAPRSAYIWRASFQVARREYPAASATLDQGGVALDDRRQFLPDLITLAKAGGDVPQAEKLTAECGRSGVKPSLASLARLLQKEAPAKAEGTYGECLAAMGYDPLQKNARPTADDSRFQQKTNEFSKKLSETLRKMGN
jgi:Zn-dependent protease with chaperone function